MTETTTELSGIEQAVAKAGSQGKLAEALGVSQQAVQKWVRRGYVPPGRVVEIEATLGVPRAKLLSPRLADLVELPAQGE